MSLVQFQPFLHLKSEEQAEKSRSNHWKLSGFKLWHTEQMSGAKIFFKSEHMILAYNKLFFFQTRLLPSIKKDPVSKKSSDKSRLKKAA